MKRIAEGLLEGPKNVLQLAVILASEWLLPLQALPEIRREFLKVKALLLKTAAKMNKESLAKTLGALSERVLQEGTLAFAEGMRGMIASLLLEH